MITKNEALKFIKPGVKILVRRTFNGRKELSVYTITELIDIGDNTIVFIDKKDKMKVIYLKDIENFKVITEEKINEQ
jgi:hypothetical protein